MSVLHLTKETFANEVLHTSLPVLIDFWAPWCGPCRMVSPMIDQLAQELKGTAKVCKINIDEEPELASAFGVMSNPHAPGHPGRKNRRPIGRPQSQRANQADDPRLMVIPSPVHSTLCGPTAGFPCGRPPPTLRSENTSTCATPLPVRCPYGGRSVHASA